MEQPLQNPIEDQRKAALEHYQEASRAICHWSSFVESAIKAYNPEAVVTFSEPKEAEKEEKPDLEESIKAFNKFMDELPEETLNEIVKEVNATGIDGPTVEEYFASLSPATKRYVAELQQEITTLRARIVELETEKSGQKQG